MALKKMFIIMFLLFPVTFVLGCNDESIKIPKSSIAAIELGTKNNNNRLFFTDNANYEIKKSMSIWGSPANIAGMNRKVLIKNEYKTETSHDFLLVSNKGKQEIVNIGGDNFYTFKRAKMVYFLSFLGDIQSAFNFDTEKFTDVYFQETPVGTAFLKQKYYLFTIDNNDNLNIRDAQSLKLVRKLKNKTDSNVIQEKNKIYFCRNNKLLVINIEDFMHLKVQTIPIKAHSIFYNSKFGFIFQNDNQTYSLRKKKFIENLPTILDFAENSLIVYKEIKNAVILRKVDVNFRIERQIKLEGSPISDYIINNHEVLIITDPDESLGIQKIDIVGMKKENLLPNRSITAIDDLGSYKDVNISVNHIADELPEDIKP